MKLPELFRTYLLSRNLSRVTVKNYVSDIRKFISWFGTFFGKAFQSHDLTPDVVTLFEKLKPFPNRSLGRYLSSLRKFATFLKDEGYISQNPFQELTAKSQQPTAKQDPWFLKDFKDYLYVFGSSSLTIKNYFVDINAFTTWLEDIIKADLNVSNNYLPCITSEIMDQYKKRLVYTLRLSPKTVNRKLSAIRKYLEFAKSQGHISKEYPISNIQYPISKEALKLEDIEEASQAFGWSASGGKIQPVSKIPPIRLLLSLLTPYLYLEDYVASRIAEFIKYRRLSMRVSDSRDFLSMLIHHAKYTRPEWYKRYHSYTFTHYFHLTILIIYASVTGFILYNTLFAEPRERIAFALPTIPSRILSFQGRLTDNNDNPITTPTDLRFTIYTSETASGAALLWQEEHYNVAPDNDGLFSLLLGAKFAIPATTFRDHDILYLGITIGQTQELTPRQRLAAVAYAANSESLAGMLPITDPSASENNVVLALDSSGNLTIGGEASPTFAVTGGQFKLSGKTLLLASETGSNGDIEIIPDGLGRIDIQRPLVNDSDASESGTLIPGALWINDKVAVIASESAVAAFIINNNTSGGDIFAASSSGITRFKVANDGDLTLTADTITASSLSTFTTASTLAISAATLNLGGGVAATIGTESGDNLTITPNGIGELTLTSDYDTGVNIGTSSNTPAPLSVSGGIGANAAFIVNQTNSGGAILTASSSGTTRLTLGNSGTLTLTSGITESNTGQYLCVNTTTFEVSRNNTACSLSSARFKENINDLNYGLTDVLKLRPVTFTFKPEMNMGSDLQVGFIAEEVEKIIPELVSYDSQGRPSGVNYPNMTAILARAVQELADKMARLDQVIQKQIVVINELLASSQLSVVSANEIVSPLASIEKIHTNIISPLAGPKIEVIGDLNVEGNATVSGELAADTISGNQATISGNLSSETLITNDATISGTLYASNIKADSIEGLEDRIASVAAQTASNGQYSNSSPSANIASDTFDTFGTFGTSLYTDFVDIQNLSGDFATFRDGLISLGPTTLTQTTVLDSLSIGTSLVIGPNSLDTLGQTLEIQPLKQGAISFMAGAVRIETDGTLKVTGNADFASDVSVKGKLSANVVSPLPDTPLVIARSTPLSVNGDEAIATDSALLDIQGSASISGTLTSRKINLAFAEQAFATSDTEAIATGSAGTAILPQYRKELTIKNPNVTSESLIYITPVGNTNNKVLYILRQVPENPTIKGLEGSFTVGVSSASTAIDIRFNWIIVN